MSGEQEELRHKPMELWESNLYFGSHPYLHVFKVGSQQIGGWVVNE